MFWTQYMSFNYQP